MSVKMVEDTNPPIVPIDNEYHRLERSPINQRGSKPPMVVNVVISTGRTRSEEASISVSVLDPDSPNRLEI